MQNNAVILDMYQTSTYLTLYYTMLTFNDLEKEAF